MDWAVPSHSRDVSVDLYLFSKVPGLYERTNATAIINFPLFEIKSNSTQSVDARIQTLKELWYDTNT